MREPSWSLVPTAKYGLSRVAPCHHSVLSAPPPPRLVGLYTSFDCACATPAEASICAANGAVSPSPTIIWTKPRRLRRPVLTWVISSLSSSSSMGSLRDSRGGHPLGVVSRLGGSTVTGWFRLYRLASPKCQDP